MEKQDVDIKEIRELANKFTPQEIEGCIQQQLKEGENICDVKGPTEYAIGELAKAGVVKKLMEKGMSITDAVRELARRIRLVQKGFKEE
jgi:malate/lactate dehydrogenase